MQMTIDCWCLGVAQVSDKDKAKGTKRDDSIKNGTKTKRDRREKEKNTANWPTRTRKEGPCTGCCRFFLLPCLLLLCACVMLHYWHYSVVREGWEWSRKKNNWIGGRGKTGFVDKFAAIAVVFPFVVVVGRSSERHQTICDKRTRTSKERRGRRRAKTSKVTSWRAQWT